jgi:hypothetical protein
MQLLDQYHPDAAAVRYPEPVSRYPEKNTGRQRSRIEGVILEALGSRAVEIPLAGPLGSISAKLGSGSGAKKYLDQKELRGLDWSKLQKNDREAVLAAVAVLPRGK